MALKDLFKLKKNKAEIDEDKNADALEENIGEAVSEEVSKQAEEYAAEKPKPLKERLVKTKKGFFTKLKEVFTGKPIDDEMYEELEDLLIQSDLGFDMTLRVIEELEERVKKAKVKDSEEVYEILKQILREKISSENSALDIVDGKLNIILVVGVNGVGKTTSIGKIASKLKQKNKKVIIGAADTFRAAAIEQLEEWGKRTGVEVIKQSHGSDPGAVVFDTISTARSKKYDVAIIDTAGRLHNKSDLMKELEKINKIIIQQSGEDNFEKLLVIDSTTGQNGLQQAKLFNEIVDLSGVILTKFDGTAKGGIIFAISDELKKPIKYLGVGEGIEDLREFNADEFVNAIFD
ncbi:MAG: signal recognition particle-docking protein FtsY [Sebaldella sp.]|uniref:signal recognition particle-docking protein FtsY n=1 Tax=Sebaldella termitidis TaxID=826 RepID=UPI001B481561|nr:signal recognition particle-docking protein FtsY [Sebaldella sp.]